MRYRGRHRAPSTAGKTAAKFVLAGGVGALGFAVAPAASAAPAGVLDEIERCESDGRNVPNSAGSSASGFWQITDGTWADNGGLQFSQRAIDATRAEQETVARRLLGSRGTQPWVSSQHCWGGRAGSSPGTAESQFERFDPKRAAASGAVTSTAGKHRLGVRGPDGTGVYRCSPSTLSFEDCDRSDLGEVVRFPKYDRLLK